MRFATGVAVLTSQHHRAATLVAIIIPIDEDLAYRPRDVERLVHQLGRDQGHRGPTAAFYRLEPLTTTTD